VGHRPWREFQRVIHHRQQVCEDEIADDLIRAYSKIRLWKIGDADLGLLFFLQYADRDNNTVSTNQDLESEPLSSDAENEYTLEVNPWLNYKFGKSYSILDFCSRFPPRDGKHSSTVEWCNGATQKGHQEFLPYESGFSPSWESFSRGRYTFFATGFEASTAINVTGRFHALASLLLLRKYSFITKEYGSSDVPSGGTEYAFNGTHTRHDYKN
jgi:hypothetical protein